MKNRILQNSYGGTVIKYDVEKSGVRMPLITSRRSPYVFQAALDARRSGLEKMAGDLHHE